MATHIYHLKLDSPVVHLSDVDDLIGKSVVVTVREVREPPPGGKLIELRKCLDDMHAAGIFPYREITDSVAWQREIRNEWD